MPRPKKIAVEETAVVEEVTVDGISFDKIEATFGELEEAVELLVVEKMAEVPTLKNVFVFTDCDTGKHHAFDTKEEADTFKEGKNGLIRTGIYNVANKNIDVIFG
jgi:hypothetical protein